MGRKHDPLRLRASLSFLNYYQITDRIRYHIVRIGCGFLLNQLSHFFFIAGDSLGLGQPIEEDLDSNMSFSRSLLFRFNASHNYCFKNCTIYDYILQYAFCKM